MTMLSALDLYRTRGTSSGGGSNSVSAASPAAGDGGGGDQASKTLRASSSSPSAKEWTSNAAPSPTPELKKCGSTGGGLLMTGGQRAKRAFLNHCSSSQNSSSSSLLAGKEKTPFKEKSTVGIVSEGILDSGVVGLGSIINRANPISPSEIGSPLPIRPTMKPSASSRKPGPVAAASPVGTSPTIPAFAGATAAAAAAASTPAELPPLSEDEAEVTERLLPPPDSLDVTDTVDTHKSGHLFVKNKKAVAKPALQNNTEVLQVVNETMSPSQNKFQVCGGSGSTLSSPTSRKNSNQLTLERKIAVTKLWRRKTMQPKASPRPFRCSMIKSNGESGTDLRPTDSNQPSQGANNEDRRYSLHSTNQSEGVRDKLSLLMEADKLGLGVTRLSSPSAVAAVAAATRSSSISRNTSTTSSTKRKSGWSSLIKKVTETNASPPYKNSVLQMSSNNSKDLDTLIDMNGFPTPMSAPLRKGSDTDRFSCSQHRSSVGALDSSDETGQQPKSLVLDVGGRRHKVLESNFMVFPNTRLGKLVRATKREEIMGLCDGYLEGDVPEYFFDRNWTSFNSILDIYRTGVLHLGTDLCALVLQKDLEYWQIDELILEPCCALKYYPEIEICVKEQKGEKEAKLKEAQRLEDESFGDNCIGKTRTFFWNLMEYPETSRNAQIMAFTSLGVVLISTMTFVLGTFPEFQTDDPGIPPEYPLAVSIMAVIDNIAVGFFFLEYLIRFLCAPKKVQFFFGAMNLVDLFAILPFFLDLIIGGLQDFEIMGKAGKIVRLVRVMRIMRIFKLVRHFAGLQSLIYTLNQAYKELGLLMLLVGVAVLTFSSLVYFAEKDNPNGAWSFLDSFWWGLMTLTTVGYGDLSPHTFPGKLIGGLCALGGIFILTLPIPIVVNSFASYYKNRLWRNEVAYKKRTRARKRKEMEMLMRDNLLNILTVPGIFGVPNADGSVEKFTMLGMDGDATAAAPSGDMDDVQEEVEGEEQEEQLDEINRSSSKGSKSELNVVKSDPDLKSESKK